MKPNSSKPALTRRQFLGGTLATAAAAASLGLPNSFSAESPKSEAKPAEFKRKIKLGVIGNGGRGAWIAKLFQKHGGYEMFAVADYFQAVADRCGNALGVDGSRRFSTLSGYKKLIECGVEPVAIETPPHFMPEQASAAVEAGLHVYMAKPVAPDVPGCLQVAAAAQKATARQTCFLVDYQIPTDPVNNEVVRRIHAKGFGRIAQIATAGIGGGSADPPKSITIADRLQHLIWVNDVALGCDYLGNFDIHAIDAALWVLGQRPVVASGASSVCRPEPHGDSRDVCSVIFEYADGVVHNHFGQALSNQAAGELSCRVYAQRGHALISYWGKFQLRSYHDAYSGEVENLYEAGASRNIATFYRNITEAHFENITVGRAVDGALTCILGYEAASRRGRLTMAELLKQNKRLEVDLTGLKA